MGEGGIYGQVAGLGGYLTVGDYNVSFGGFAMGSVGVAGGGSYGLNLSFSNAWGNMQELFGGPEHDGWN